MTKKEKREIKEGDLSITLLKARWRDIAKGLRYAVLAAELHQNRSEEAVAWWDMAADLIDEASKK